MEVFQGVGFQGVGIEEFQEVGIEGFHGCWNRESPPPSTIIICIQTYCCLFGIYLLDLLSGVVITNLNIIIS